MTDRDGTSPGAWPRRMAPELGWDERREAAEARAFLDEAAAEGIVAGG